MINQPRIQTLLDLGDGLPPIACNGPQEAAFFDDLWLGYHGDQLALARARRREESILAYTRQLRSGAYVRP